MTRRRAWPPPRQFLTCLGLACLLLGLLGPAGRAAAEGATGRVSGTGGLGVWLKAQPDLAAARVVALPEGTPLTLLAGPRIAGNGRFWAQVSALGATGWMVGDFLLLDRVAAPNPPPKTALGAGAPPPPPAPTGLAPGATATVTGTAPADGLHLRAGPDPAQTLLATLPEGSTVQVASGPTTGANGDPWYTVAAGGATGWVDGVYLVPATAPPPPPTESAPPPLPAGAVLAPGAWAQVTGTSTANGLRVRAAPDPAQTQLAILPETSRVQVAGGPTTGANGDPWYQVTANGATGWVDGVYLAPADPPAADPATATARGAALVNVTLQQLGKKYGWGTTGPDTFDCSGLVLYVAQTALGIPLPRTTFEQAFAGVHVDRDQLRPGDLVFFANTYAPGITHVGIYIGAGRWVTAEDEDTGVVVLSLDSPYWSAHYAGARRIT